MIKYFLLFALTISYGIKAQNKMNGTENEKYYQVISFGEKIDFGNVGISASWKISNLKEGVFASLKGNQINDYQFQKLGEYEIYFSELHAHHEGCNHPSFPAKMLVKVNPVKLTFDFSKIQFSEKLEKGRNYEDLIITIPATIVSKDKSVVKLPAPKMDIAGVGSLLKAEPMNTEIVIKDGVQLLKYKVSGIVNRETYLMFDFYDFNNQVQSYTHRQIIN